MSESLIALAETLNAARIAANADPATEAWTGVYGKVAEALEETLVLILQNTLTTGATLKAETVYESLLDGCTVREALAVVE